MTSSVVSSLLDEDEYFDGLNESNLGSENEEKGVIKIRKGCGNPLSFEPMSIPFKPDYQDFSTGSIFKSDSEIKDDTKLNQVSSEVKKILLEKKCKIEEASKWEWNVHHSKISNGGGEGGLVTPIITISFRRYTWEEEEKYCTITFQTSLPRLFLDKHGMFGNSNIYVDSDWRCTVKNKEELELLIRDFFLFKGHPYGVKYIKPEQRGKWEGVVEIMLKDRLGNCIGIGYATIERNTKDRKHPSLKIKPKMSNRGKKSLSDLFRADKNSIKFDTFNVIGPANGTGKRKRRGRKPKKKSIKDDCFVEELPNSPSVYFNLE